MASENAESFAQSIIPAGKSCNMTSWDMIVHEIKDMTNGG